MSPTFRYRAQSPGPALTALLSEPQPEPRQDDNPVRSLLSIPRRSPRFELSLSGVPEDVYRIPSGGGQPVHCPARQRQWDDCRVQTMLHWHRGPLTRCVVSIEVLSPCESTNPARFLATTLQLLKAAGVIQLTGPSCVEACVVRSRWSRSSRIDVTLWSTGEGRN